MFVRLTLLPAVLLISTACTDSFRRTTLHHRQSGYNIALIPPSQDPFYEVPANITKYQRGAIIRERKVPNISDTFGPDSGDVYQLFFRTNGVRMKPDAAVTTVVAPRKPAIGPPKIVAIGSPTDSPAVDCALSWALYPDTMSQEKEKGAQTFTFIAKAVLHQGYYVTLPDQGGSKAAWTAYSEGQVILDGARAIIDHKKTIPDSSGVKVALAGYSGGGHGAAWAGQLASTYGNGIPIIALAAGGIPVDSAASMTFLDSKLAAAFIFSGIAGLANAYPDYHQYILRTFKPNGTAAFLTVKNGSHCLSQSVVKYAFKSIFGSMIDRNFIKSPTSQLVLNESYLGKNQKPITDFPVYQVHSQVDDVVVYKPALEYFKSQCSKGAKIIFSNPNKGKHMMTQAKSIPSFVYFIKAAFEGNLRLNACHEMTDYLIPYDGPQAVDVASKPIVEALKEQVRIYTVADWVEGLST